MNPTLLKAAVAITAMRLAMTDKMRDERGEGVISVAIAVLIMAGIGAIAWVAFQAIFNDAANSARDTINNDIG